MKEYRNVSIESRNVRLHGNVDTDQSVHAPTRKQSLPIFLYLDIQQKETTQLFWI